MTTPAVIEKTLMDIDFSKGVNESESQYHFDWTKYLKAADNVDTTTPGVLPVRKGLYGPTGLEQAPDSTLWTSMRALAPIGRLLPTSKGLLSVQLGGTAVGDSEYQDFSTVMRLRHLDESSGTSSGMWTMKNKLGEFSVSKQTVGGLHTTAPNVCGAANTTHYKAVVLNNGGVDYSIIIVDSQSGNVVKSMTVVWGSAGDAVVTAVGEILHVYIGYAGNARCYQFNLTSAATIAAIDASTSYVALTSGDVPLACVPNSSSSVVLMSNRSMSRVNQSLTESATGTCPNVFTTFDDLATDGTNFYVSGIDSGTTSVRVQKLSSAFASVTQYLSATGTGVTKTSIGSSTTGTFYVLGHGSATFGGGTVPLITVFDGNMTVIGYIPGAGGLTSPFFNAASNKIYASIYDLPQLGNGAGHSSSAVLGSNFIVNLSENWQFDPYIKTYPLVAITDSYTDYCANNATTGFIKPQKAFSSDGGKNVVFAAVNKSGSASYSVELRTLKLNDVTVVGCSDNIISGGRTSSYDGLVASELGTVHTPAVAAVDAGSGSGLAAGSYSYVIVWEFTDSNGNRHFSKTSNPASITLGGAADVDVTFTAPTVTEHTVLDQGYSSNTQSKARWHLYRTLSGGTQYYKVYTGATVSGWYYTVRDNVPDSTLQSNDLMYRQPGTQGTALDRFYAIASSCVARHKDRVFYASGDSVYYSSFDVFGEAPWFNPALKFEVPGGTGPITALASIDGLLVVFKRNAVFVVDGDGPPENGGSGTEFSPPRRVANEVGCVDQRSLVYTRSGIMFRSEFSIELLRRNMTVVSSGQFVQNTLDSNPYTGGAAYDPATGRAVWIVGSTAGTWPGQLDGTATGYALVYDTVNDAWTRYKLRNDTGYGYSYQDVVSGYIGCDGASIPKKTRLVYGDQTRIYFESGYVDTLGSTGYFVPVNIETGWIRTMSKQDRVRVSDLIIGAYRNADCTVSVSYAQNYNPSYTQVSSWAPSTTGALTVVQLESQLPRESLQSVSFKIESSDPTPASYGTGQQMDIFAITVKAGLKGGGVKLASSKKG